MKITCEINKNDLIDFQVHHLCSMENFEKKIKSGRLYMVFFTAAAILVLKALLHWELLFYISSTLLGAYALFSVIVMKRRYIRSIRKSGEKMFSEDKALNTGTVEIDFLDDSIVEKTKTVETRVLRDSIVKITQSETAFYIYYSVNQVFIVKRDAVTDMDAFKDYFGDKIQ